MESTSCNKMMIDLFLAGIVLILIQGIWASTNMTQTCFNGGTPSYNESTLECTCPENTTGSRCENTNTNTTHTCFNGGTPSYNESMLECMCPENTTGSRCENTSTNMTQTCYNGETPFFNETTLECTCPGNTTNSSCENTNNNMTQTCFSGGTLSYNESKMECTCPDNTTESRCTNMTITCFNGGTPFYNESTWECTCPYHTIGSRCENETCLLFECHNNGTVVTRDDFCECACPENFTGIVCETELLPSQWPDGPYALLMPTSGCPESTKHGWGAGFIRFTTTHKMDIWREFNYTNGDVKRMRLAENTSSLAGPFHTYSFQLNFCFKHTNSSVESSTVWPELNVSVYGDSEGCPYGFDEEINYLPLPPLGSWWNDGYLPYFEIRDDAKESLLITKHCHLNEAKTNNTWHMGDKEPFILVKAYGHRCPSVAGFDIEEETLQFISTSHHFIEKRQQTNLSYCFYKQEKVNDLHPSSWPNGPYAVLMLNTGCPEPLNHGWQVSYMLFEHKYGLADVSGIDECQGVHILGKVLELYHHRDFQVFFCFKYGQQDQANEIPWPRGNYSILGTDKGCPEGFQENDQTLEMYASSVLSTTGPLPFYEVDSSGRNILLNLKLCDKTDAYMEFSSDWKKPFAFPTPKVSNCVDEIKGFSLQKNKVAGLGICIYIPVEEERNVCAAQDFRCDDGRCIRFAHRCDHEGDCVYGEDEVNCTYSCDKDNSSCYNKCLNTSTHCDGAKNCTENVFDQDNHCEQDKHAECYKYEMKCDSGECVKGIHVCDNIRDCRDGSDEQPDHCSLRCARNTFPCRSRDRFKCITKSWICDEFGDCDGKKDELPSSCPLICNQGELYRGKNFRLSQTTPVCMSTDDETEPRTALGLRTFCKNRNRCTKVNDICDVLLPQKLSANADKQSKTSCQRSLGLMDGSIKDSQLASSSYEQGHQSHMVRPTKSSWCPHKNETAPFLEVKLSYATVVGGLILYNSVEIGGTIVNNSYIPEAIPVGCGAFSIQYALFQNKYSHYSNEYFEVDESMEIDKPQRFTFLRPFLARYVRVYPLKKILNGSMCLKMELLGCPQSGDDTLSISLSKLEQFNLPISGPYELSNMIRSSDKIYTWNITVADGGYIKLSFLTINLYNQSGLYTESCLQDFISFNELFEPITAQYNNQTPIFPTDKTRLLMSFVSCAREIQGHSSFSVLFNKEDVPTIWGNIKDINILEGKVITFSFLGLFVNLPKRQTWILNSIVHGRPLVLTVEIFNIPCDSASSLSIRTNSAYRDSRLCNTKRRPRKTYKAWELDIIFRYDDSVSLNDPEGFSAVYRVEPVPEKHNWLSANEGYEPPTDKGQLGVYTVYFPTARKHYRFSYQAGFEDWRTQAKHCERLNSSLVVIHGRSEYEFLKSWIFYRMVELFTAKSERQSAKWLSTNSYSWKQNQNLYFHIGLLRYEGINGLKEIWQDGTSPSFTAWDTGEPKSVSSNKCTGMQVNMTTGEGRWVTRACSEAPRRRLSQFMFASICEKPMGDTPSAAIDSYNTNAGDNFNATRVQAVRLFKCNSTEWVSHLAKCDGIPDCIDGSDETDCRRNRTDTCSGDMFLCKNGECLPIGKVCNYINDCADNSDEYCYKSPCADEEFQCHNKQCIPGYLRCNAVNDCIDGSDEVQCVTCNKTTAFPCISDLTCIDKSMVCDNTGDCADDSDETNCAETYSSCLGYWQAGRDGNVSIDLSDAYMECQFNATEDILKIMTSVDMKKQWRTVNSDNPNNIPLENIQLDMDDFSGFGDSCLMQVTAYCPKYNIDANCVSETYSIPLANNSFSGQNIYGDQFTIYVYSRRIEIQRKKEHGQKLIKVHPAICISEPMDISQIIRCGDGKNVSSERECLYDINTAGFIDGCLNYEHLENCEMFKCPGGYFKCPFSFCLAQRHMCDGERQCPGGEDEIDCWCRGSRNNTVLIYNEEFNREVVPFFHQFARQLYSPNAEMYSVRYYVDSTVQAFIVYKSPIHPFNDGLYLGEVENFTLSIPMYKLYEEISNILNTSERINIINIEQNDWLLHKGNFVNSSIIDHVYHISMDPNLRQRAMVTTEEQESVLKINDWKLLASAGSTLFPTLCQAKMVATCVDQFRCLSSKVCIPVDQICDGTPQCPYEDDEVMCDFKCHAKCSCRLYIADCHATNFTKQDFVELDTTVRVFDMSENYFFEEGKLEIPKPFPYLITLIAKNCGIISVDDKTFRNAKNIRHLDLSFNRIKVITTTTFEGLGRLELLNLKGNNYIESIQPKAFKMLTSLSDLTITNTRLREIQADTFWGLNVTVLNISHNRIRRLHNRSFNRLSALEIDFYGNDVDVFDSDIFTGIDIVRLKTIRSAAYKFCCVKPPSLSDNNCWPHQDEFSSCEDLMRNPILQTLVWVLGAAAVVANGCTVFYRLVYDRKSLKKGFGMFVTNLAASDFLMGVYMIIIAVADITFRNRYIMMDDYWRNSLWCDLAGILATVSSEASVLFMCLITLDRILVIKYPFGQFKFSPKSSKIALIFCWTISLIIALVPILVQDYFKGKFYSTSGVCLALPLTHRRPPGWLYSFLIYVALNFMAFIMIAIGQLVIYLEIKASSKRMRKVRSQRRNDIRIAKNLLLVLSTDFLCWFPVGVMAILAATGYVIPGETYAWTAVLIVPINAALNPFLYTLSAVLQKKTASVKKISVTERSIPERSNNEQTIVSKDTTIQRNIGTNTVVPDALNVHVNTPLDEVQPSQIILEPKEVLLTCITTAKNIAFTHNNNHVCGGLNIRDVLYSTEGRKIRMCSPYLLKAGSKEDKGKDVYEFGCILEHLLKFTKPSRY